ncbi:MAG: hypothetical protein R2726_02000 [Acidimicrobiales bacterium]
MARPPRRTAGLLLAATVLAAAACGTKDDEPGGNGGPPLREDGPPTLPTTIPTATTASPCPTETVLTVQTKDGQRTLRAARAYADVTLDSSASITIASYDLSEGEASKVFQPSLTGDQLAVNVYVSTPAGSTLTPGSYTPSKGGATADTNPTRQLNSYTVWSSAGREISSGFNQVEPEVTITSIDRLQVCGEITTPEARGRFAATRI